MRQYKFLMPGQWKSVFSHIFCSDHNKVISSMQIKDFLQACDELFSQTVQIMLGQQSEII